MKIINLERRKIIFSDYVKRTALEKDCSRLIKEDVLITENGAPKILYKKLDIDTSEIRNAIKKVKFDTSIRTSGLKSTSRVFGYNPRNVIRRDYCSASGLASQQSYKHAVIANFGAEIAKLYVEYFPEIYEMHNAEVESKIQPEWRMKDAPFTSGIINKNNPLKYHFDSGNIKDVLSNMIVFKNKTEGGFLACPEFDIMFEADNNSVVLFDGQSILHGVTPIKNETPNSWRYSVVYYTLQQMWKCLPLSEEIARIRKLHLTRERNRANGVDVTKLNKDK